jgi:hypothetical protein
MKFLKLILPVFVCLLSANVVFAQPQVYTQNTSSPAACDGVAWIDSTFNSSTTQWMGGGAVMQTGGLYIYNLCPGTYVVSATSFLGGSYTLTFTIGSGNSNPCANFTLSLSYTDATTSSTCDGTAQAFVSGGTAPYTYTWGQGATTSAINNLCIGTYQICATDANGCITCDNATIGDASAMDSVLVFNNNPFPGGVVTGVLATDSLEDCTINYQNIASGSVTNSVVIGTDSLLVTWTLLDSSGVVAATYNVVYNIPNAANGIYGLTLVVYCSQKALNYNTIVINDQVMLGANALTNILNDNDLTVINPFNNQLEIRLSTLTSGSIHLINFAGQMVLTSDFSDSDNIVLNTEMLPQGAYVLSVINENGIISRFLLKK